MFTHNGRDIPIAPIQDPNNVDLWGADWSELLQEGEFLISSIWILDTDLISVDEWCSLTHTAFLMKGGINGKDYVPTNRIKTNLGSTLDRSMFIKCVNT